MNRSNIVLVFTLMFYLREDDETEIHILVSMDSFFYASELFLMSLPSHKGLGLYYSSNTSIKSLL